jgi:hypothetical protein
MKFEDKIPFDHEEFGYWAIEKREAADNPDGAFCCPTILSRAGNAWVEHCGGIVDPSEWLFCQDAIFEPTEIEHEYPPK